jgi:hypothetical protein
MAGIVMLAGCNRGQAEPAPELDAPPALSAMLKAPLKVHHVKAHGQLGPGRGTLILDLKAPSGGKLTVGAPLVVRGKSEYVKLPRELKTKLKEKDLPLYLPIDVADGAFGPVELEVSYYWCSTGDSASCRPERARLFVDLDLSGSSEGGEAHLSYGPAVL